MYATLVQRVQIDRLMLRAGRGAASDYAQWTAGYNAPETVSNTGGLQGIGDHDASQVDVWALGVVLYMCLSGSPPFPLSNPTKAAELIQQGGFKAMSGARWEAIPQEAKDLVACMLVVDPEQRITVEEVLGYVAAEGAFRQAPLRSSGMSIATRAGLAAEVNKECKEAFEQAAGLGVDHNLPPGWAARVDSGSRRVYYAHDATRLIYACTY